MKRKPTDIDVTYIGHVVQMDVTDWDKVKEWLVAFGINVTETKQRERVRPKP